MDAGALLDTIDQIYATMFDADVESGWLDLVRDAAGAEHAVLAQSAGLALDTHVSRMDASMRALAVELATATCYEAPLARMPMRALQRLSDYFPLHELMRTEVYQKLVRPLHGGHAIVFQWHAGDGRGAIAICRDAARGRDFRDDECAALHPLLLHVHSALRMRARLQVLQHSIDQAHAALDALPEAVMVVDRARRVREINRRARELVRDGDGIRLDDGRLRAARADVDRRLQVQLDWVLRPGRAHIASACINVSGDARMSIPRAPPRRPLLASVLPAAAIAGRLDVPGLADAAVVVLRDPDHVPDGIVQALVELFAFTPREVQLAMALRDGGALAHVAARLGISEGTARQYLKHVFAKTGVGRQAELVALLRSLG